MSRFLVFLLTALIVVVISFFGVRFVLSQKRGTTAMLKVTSTPTASIFLDSKNIGRTPFENKHEAGEYTLKLIPEITAGDAQSWQGHITLSPNLLTYVNRELGTSELTSAGEILTLEKIKENLGKMSIITTPEGASVNLDGEDQGIAPLNFEKIDAGNHEISISSPGFLSRTIKIKATPGFKLTVTVQLALASGKAPEASGSDGSTNQPEGNKTGELAKPFVTILDTPTGWLRVRSGPSTSSTESAKVNPGEKYKLLDEKSGWYKIEYKKDEEGWISGRYAEKTE